MSVSEIESRGAPSAADPDGTPYANESNSTESETALEIRHRPSPMHANRNVVVLLFVVGCNDSLEVNEL